MKNMILTVLILHLSLFPQIFTDIEAGMLGGEYSSITWGDYDNDGDLDVFMMGRNGTEPISKIYRNDSGIFILTEQEIKGCYRGDADWGDCDNDGDLDLLITGNMTGESPYIMTRLYRNDSGVFNEITAELTPLNYSSCAWGDYDNDGDLDILLAGYDRTYHPNTMIYRNDTGAFTDIDNDIYDLSSRGLDWGDYDNDGDLDILITGGAYPWDCSMIYQNTSGSFDDISAGLEDIYRGYATWVDIDSDGDLDVNICGLRMYDDETYTTVCELYFNDSGIFTKVDKGIYPTSISAWGDYDNDGDLDILILNSGPKVFAQNYLGNFDNINTGISITPNNAAWGDYDNDGDLDLLLAGNELTTIYRNDHSHDQNTPPTSPENLTSYSNGNEIFLNWDRSEDLETPQPGLSYNVYIGTEPGSCNIVTPMSDIGTGFRRIVRFGNSGQNNFYIIKDLPEGTFYWSVQAIDNCFAGSEFAKEQSFTVTGIENDNSPFETTLYNNYPNPFNPNTDISFSLKESSRVNLSIFNSKGELVQTLFEGKKDKGNHSVEFNATELNSGIYFYKLTTESGCETRKMLLLR